MSVEFVKVAILPCLAPSHSLKDRKFVVIEMHLDEFCNGVLSGAHTETLLQHSRPIIRHGIPHLTHAKACVREVSIKDLQMSTRGRERLGQAFDEEETV